MILQIILGILAVLSCALTAWQWLAARRFRLHEREKSTPFAPAVTLLKPLKGCDAETERCLESWIQQNYRGSIQILFGVASATDPVCDLVRQLITRHSSLDAQLVICSESLGPNAKVSSLIQLFRSAKHDVIVVSDADVRVPADFLANVVQPLQTPEIGLVNCFYRYANPTTLAMQWEAIAVNADFWSQVLQSQSLKPLDFALGAIMATRRENLQAIGGFESLVDYLADDYQLGNRVAKTGKQIVISPIVVECWESPKTCAEVWKHQLRWAITIRACQPVPFFFSILSNATVWPLLLLAAAWAGPARCWAIAILVYCLLVRIATALGCQNKLSPSPGNANHLWLVPLKDCFALFTWALSFASNQIEWRGQKFRVMPGGKLQALDRP